MKPKIQADFVGMSWVDASWILICFCKVGKGWDDKELGFRRVKFLSSMPRYWQGMMSSIITH